MAWKEHIKVEYQIEEASETYIFVTNVIKTVREVFLTNSKFSSNR